MGVVAKYICTQASNNRLPLECYYWTKCPNWKNILQWGSNTRPCSQRHINVLALCCVCGVCHAQKTNTKNNTRPVQNYCYQILAKTIRVPHVCGNKFIEGWVAVTFWQMLWNQICAPMTLFWWSDFISTYTKIGEGSTHISVYSSWPIDTWHMMCSLLLLSLRESYLRQ